MLGRLRRGVLRRRRRRVKDEIDVVEVVVVVKVVGFAGHGDRYIQWVKLQTCIGVCTHSALVYILTLDKVRDNGVWRVWSPVISRAGGRVTLEGKAGWCRLAGWLGLPATQLVLCVPG